MGDVDDGLVEALRRDDPDGTGQLVARYGDRVYRLALDITGVREDAEEAAADALRTVAGTIHSFRGESPFGSWVDRTAAHAACQKLRGRRPPAIEIALADVVPPLDGDGQHFEPMDDWSTRVEEHARQGALRGILTEAVDALPADYRTALVLHDVEGVPPPEIATILGVGVPEVKSHLHRARLFVRKRLSAYFASA